MADNLYYQKYLKYKTKYFNLKMLYKNNQLGGDKLLSKNTKCGFCNSLNSLKCDYCNGLKSFSKNNQLGGNKSENNKSENNKSENNKSDVYLFKAEWCGHCKGFKSTWNKLKKELSSKYTFITLDADADKEKISSWNIQGFPTIIKKSGVNAKEYVGQRDEQSVREFIQSN